MPEYKYNVEKRFLTKSPQVPVYNFWDKNQQNRTVIYTIPAKDIEVAVTYYATDDDGKNKYYRCKPVQGGNFNGWVSEQYLYVKASGIVNDVVTVNTSGASSTNTGSVNITYQNKYTVDEMFEQYKSFVRDEYGQLLSGNATAADNLLTTNFNGVYGMPYQFPSSVDRPPSSNSIFGRYYSQRIVERMPLLMLSPGKISFMSDFKKPEKMSVMETLLSGADSDVSDMLRSEGKYYTFEYDGPSYWEYVNGMNQNCAVYLGIQDIEYNAGGVSGKLGTFDWSKATNHKFDSIVSSSTDYVCFYLDAATTKSESFSNSTTESSLAQKVNGYSDIAKEARFIMGDIVAEKAQSLMGSDAVSSVQAAVDNIAEKYLDGSPVFKDLSKEFSVVASGGKLLFPEIYSDSDFSQDFDVNIKLRCPNPDTLSWYLDILVPLNHLIAFTLPKTPEGSVNGYSTPFLVRGFYKGMFNCDMGIVSSLSFSKGKEGSWTLDGLPTEVDVSMTIKDLYNVLAMSNPKNKADFLGNTCMLNYLANSCGININKPDIMRSVDLYFNVTKNNIYNTLSMRKWWSRAQQNTKNNLLKIYQGIFRG